VLVSSTWRMVSNDIACERTATRAATILSDASNGNGREGKGATMFVFVSSP